MSKKSMEEYFNDSMKEVTDLTESNVQEAIIQIAEALKFVHEDTVNNYEMIKTQNTLIDTIIDLIEYHKHCPDCGISIWKDIPCKCKD